MAGTGAVTDPQPFGHLGWCVASTSVDTGDGVGAVAADPAGDDGVVGTGTSTAAAWAGVGTAVAGIGVGVGEAVGATTLALGGAGGKEVGACVG